MGTRPHRRRSIRLKEYDYAQAGAYFVTICVQEEKSLFGSVVDAQTNLNEAGQIVAAAWADLPKRFPSAELDESVVMPNHFHGILILGGAGMCGAPTRGARTTLGDVIGAFKSITTDEYIRGVHNLNWPRFDGRLWQRNYFEHIIRNENELKRIRQYIQDNPPNWNPVRAPLVGAPHDIQTDEPWRI